MVLLPGFTLADVDGYWVAPRTVDEPLPGGGVWTVTVGIDLYLTAGPYEVGHLDVPVPRDPDDDETARAVLETLQFLQLEPTGQPCSVGDQGGHFVTAGQLTHVWRTSQRSAEGIDCVTPDASHVAGASQHRGAQPEGTP